MSCLHLRCLGAVAPGTVQKRKSAFVRFGKRSTETSEENSDSMVSRQSPIMSHSKSHNSQRALKFQSMEKRKSAFVRFGRSIGENPDKRKSQYIRFGRK